MIEEQLAASIFNFIVGLTESRKYDPEIIDGYDCYFSVLVEKKKRFVNEDEPDETVYNYSVYIDTIDIWDEDGSEAFQMSSSLVQDAIDKLLYDFNRL